MEPSSSSHSYVHAISDQVLSDKLQFIQEIGFGNWGSVWLCQPKREEESRHKIAVKLVHRSKTKTTAARVKSLWNEMKVVKALSADGSKPHPSIIPFHSFIMTPSYAMITMEHLPTLIPVEVDESISKGWFKSLLSAIEFCHSKGVVHNDIKPANILLSRAQIPVLVDFGFAEKYDSDATNAFRSNLSYGTPEYLSPERARGHPHDTRKSDVWSLGISIFEILVGRTPFESSDGEQFTTKEDLEKYWERTVKGKWIGPYKMSRSLENLLKKMLCPNPETRYTAANACGDVYWSPSSSGSSPAGSIASKRTPTSTPKSDALNMNLSSLSGLSVKITSPWSKARSSRTSSTVDMNSNASVASAPMVRKPWDSSSTRSGDGEKVIRRHVSRPDIRTTKLAPKRQLDLSPIKASPPATPRGGPRDRDSLYKENRRAPSPLAHRTHMHTSGRPHSDLSVDSGKDKRRVSIIRNGGASPVDSRPSSPLNPSRQHTHHQRGHQRQESQSSSHSHSDSLRRHSVAASAKQKNVAAHAGAAASPSPSPAVRGAGRHCRQESADRRRSAAAGSHAASPASTSGGRGVLMDLTDLNKHVENVRVSRAKEEREKERRDREKEKEKDTGRRRESGVLSSSVRSRSGKENPHPHPHQHSYLHQHVNHFASSSSFAPSTPARSPTKSARYTPSRSTRSADKSGGKSPATSANKADTSMGSVRQRVLEWEKEKERLREMQRLEEAERGVVTDSEVPTETETEEETEEEEEDEEPEPEPEAPSTPVSEVEKVLAARTPPRSLQRRVSSQSVLRPVLASSVGSRADVTTPTETTASTSFVFEQTTAPSAFEGITPGTSFSASTGPLSGFKHRYRQSLSKVSDIVTRSSSTQAQSAVKQSTEKPRKSFDTMSFDMMDDVVDEAMRHGHESSRSATPAESETSEDRLVAWMRNVETIVEDARQNFASTSLGYTSSPPLPLPVGPSRVKRISTSSHRPWETDALNTSTNTAASRKSSRAPRKVLAAQEIFTDEGQSLEVNTSHDAALTSPKSVVSASATEVEVDAPDVSREHDFFDASFFKSKDMPDLKFDFDREEKDVMLDHGLGEMTPRRRRVTLSVGDAEDLLSGSPKKRRESRTRSQGDLLQRKITPVDTLEREIDRLNKPISSTPSRLSAVFDRSLFLSPRSPGQSSSGYEDSPLSSPFGNRTFTDDLTSSPCVVEPYPKRVSALNDSSILDSPSERRLESVYDRFLMATTSVRRVGKGYQNEALSSSQTTSAGPSAYSSSRAFYTAKKPMPPPVSSDDLREDPKFVDEMGIMSAEQGVGQCNVPVKGEGRQTVAIVRRALKAIVHPKNVNRRVMPSGVPA